MQLIVCKVVKLPPRSEKNKTFKTKSELAFVDGVTQDLYNTCFVRINKMTSGRYIFFYTADFNKNQLCRKLNVILNCKSKDKNIQLTRVSARKFGAPFLKALERKNLER